MSARWTGLVEKALPPALALAIALLVGNLLIIVNGEQPLRVWSLLVAGTWGSGYGMGQVLFKAAPLALAGYSVGLAFRAGLFNVGGEGQIQSSALACAVVGAALPAWLPWPLAVLVCTLAAVCCGACVGAVPGWLRARFGAHEVITTIMLNFVVLAVIGYLVAEHLALPETLHTREIAPGATLGRLADTVGALRGSAASWGLLVVPFAGFAYWWFLERTTWGLEHRTVGLSPGVAEANGVNVARVRVLAMTLAGGFAALSAVPTVLGYKHFYEQGFGAGVGFMGIAVALLGQGNPWGIVAAALLFGTLSQGGLAINALVPKDLIDVLQAAVILVVVAASREVQAVLRRGVAASRASTKEQA